MPSFLIIEGLEADPSAHGVRKVSVANVSEGGRLRGSDQAGAEEKESRLAQTHEF